MTLKLHQPWNQIAKDYENEIISPITHANESTVLSSLQILKDKHKKTVLELGCGTGSILKKLLNDFKEVHAVDFSQNMLTMAMQQLSLRELQKCHFYELDFVNLMDLNLSRVDIVIAINSIIGPEEKKRSKIWSNISKTLRENGIFIAVVPAFESWFLQYSHAIKENIHNSLSIKKAKEKANSDFETRRMNLKSKVYDTGDMLQKHYTKHELKTMFKKYGFKEIQFSKITYPKEYAFVINDKYHNLPKMFDWFFLVQKIK